MNSRITIYKPTSDIWREYQQSDIYVLTSLREAFGMVLIEAMSYGLPCIAFDSPFGPAEIITDGVNGRLVPVGNESALTDSLRWLMTHDDERLRMGRQARESIRRFEIDAVMKRWQELFVTGETSA
jgi:glycosyltransferase involved in cell wall biosynthesis